ncbi:hypothetical protein [Embleya sp. NPDC059237]|uniref:hypothetical protein n=1 Tax=Embleya sp. NPDC059237 TaxID=3346784 RepID=UPI0036AE0375
MPTSDELPSGQRRNFVEELHHYYRAAGRPVLRDLEQPLKKSAVSRETARRLLRGETLSRWTSVQAVFEALCAISKIDPDATRWGGEWNNDDDRSSRQYLRDLWNEAVDEPPRTARVHRLDDPWATSTSRQAQGGYGIPSDEPPF